MGTVWARLRFRAATAALVFAVGMVQIVSVTPIGSYELTAARTGKFPTGSWAYGLLGSRSSISLVGDPLRVDRTLATVRIRFTGHVLDDAGASVAGIPVTFTTATLSGGSVGCTATTDATGAAACTALQGIPAVVLAPVRTYRMAARQSGAYQAGSGTGRIIWQ